MIFRDDWPPKLLTGRRICICDRFEGAPEGFCAVLAAQLPREVANMIEHAWGNAESPVSKNWLWQCLSSLRRHRN
jgi:hypothetical protein